MEIFLALALFLALFGFWRGLKVLAIAGLVAAGFFALMLYPVVRDLSQGNPTVATATISGQGSIDDVARNARARSRKAVDDRKQEIDRQIAEWRTRVSAPAGLAATPQELAKQYQQKQEMEFTESQFRERAGNQPIYPRFSPAELDYRWQNYTHDYWDTELRRHCGPIPAKDDIAQGKTPC